MRRLTLLYGQKQGHLNYSGPIIIVAYSDRNRAVLMNVQSPHKLWSTLQSEVFGSSSSLPLLVSEGGGLVCESVGEADLLSNHFDSKQSRETVDLSLTCHLSPSLTTFAFRSRGQASLDRLELEPLWWH